MTTRGAVLRVARCAIATAALAIAACGGGGGGGGPVATPCLTFTGREVAGAGRVVLQPGSGSTCDVVAVDCRVASVNDLFAASFTLEFDPALVVPQGYSVANSVLASGGAQVEVLWDEAPGRATFGITRIATSGGVDVAGDGLLVRLYFLRLKDAGNGTAAFPEGQLVGWGNPPVVIEGVRWVGGTFTID